LVMLGLRLGMGWVSRQNFRQNFVLFCLSLFFFVFGPDYGPIIRFFFSSPKPQIMDKIIRFTILLLCLNPNSFFPRPRLVREIIAWDFLVLALNKDEGVVSVLGVGVGVTVDLTVSVGLDLGPGLALGVLVQYKI
jgi:hypothetical protein